jgi:hypothetical protein
MKLNLAIQFRGMEFGFNVWLELLFAEGFGE